jgi:hypothetical protein
MGSTTTDLSHASDQLPSFAGAAMASCLCMAAAYIRVIVQPPTTIAQRFALSAVARELISVSVWGVLATVELPGNVRVALVLAVLTLRYAITPVLSALFEPCCFGDRRSRARQQLVELLSDDECDEDVEELGPFGRDEHELPWYDADLLDGRCHLLPTYEVPVSVNHFAHRMGTLVVVVLAMSLEALVPRAGLDLGRASGLLAKRIYPLLACFLVVVVCLKGLYLGLDVPGRARAHGLRRHRFSRLVWEYSHLALSAGVIVLTMGMRGMIATTANKTPSVNNQGSKKGQWLAVASLDPLLLYTQGLGVVLLSLLLILLSHRPRWSDLLQLLNKATSATRFPGGTRTNHTNSHRERPSESAELQAQWEAQLYRLRKLRVVQILAHAVAVVLCWIGAPERLLDVVLIDAVSESRYLAPCVVSAVVLIGLVALHLMDDLLESKFWKLHRILMELPFDDDNDNDDGLDYQGHLSGGGGGGATPTTTTTAADHDRDRRGGDNVEGSSVLLQTSPLSPNLMYRQDQYS